MPHALSSPILIRIYYFFRRKFLLIFQIKLMRNFLSSKTFFVLNFLILIFNITINFNNKTALGWFVALLWFINYISIYNDQSTAR